MVNLCGDSIDQAIRQSLDMGVIELGTERGGQSSGLRYKNGSLRWRCSVPLHEKSLPTPTNDTRKVSSPVGSIATFIRHSCNLLHSTIDSYIHERKSNHSQPSLGSRCHKQPPPQQPAY